MAEGVVAAIVTYRRAFQRAFAGNMPFAVALLELDAGVRLQVHVREPGAVRHGQRARLTFAGLVAGGPKVPLLDAAA